MVARLAQSFIEHLKSCAGIADNLDTVELISMEAGNVDVDVFDIRVLEHPFRGRREVRVARANTDDYIGIFRQRVGSKAARLADTAHIERMLPSNRAFAGLRLAERDAVFLSEFLEDILSLGVFNAAAENQERTLSFGNGLDSFLNCTLGRFYAVDVMNAFLEEVLRIIPSLALDILRQSDADSTRLSRVCEHAHRVDAGRHEDFRTRYAVPVLADGTERIVRRRRQADCLLHLLEYRIRLAVSVRVTRQEQDRNAVCRSRSSCRDHVGSARADRRRASVHLFAAFLLCKTDGSVCHALLIAAHAHDQVARIFFECFAEADDVAVTEDTEDTFEHRDFFAIEFDILIIEEFDESLCYRHSDCLSHWIPSTLLCRI